MTNHELKEFLDEKVILYNNCNFIDSDPIQIPHQYSLKEDIEISGFLGAIIMIDFKKNLLEFRNTFLQTVFFLMFGK